MEIKPNKCHLGHKAHDFPIVILVLTWTHSWCITTIFMELVELLEVIDDQ